MQIWLISSSSDEFENFEEIPCHLTLIQPWDLDIINNFSIYLFSHCTLKPFEKFKKVSVIFFNIRNFYTTCGQRCTSLLVQTDYFFI